MVDVDPITYTIDLASAEAAIGERTRALVAVHLFGHPADMDAICGLAHRHELAIVEDAAQALGSTCRGRRCGTIGDVGCFSFNGNKIITAGGGGMVLASDPGRLEQIRHLSFQSREPGSHEYLHDGVGFNYALSNLHAAVGLAQLEKLEQVVAGRRRAAARYASALEDAEGLRFAGEAAWACSNFWLMSVLIDAAACGRSREDDRVRSTMPESTRDRSSLRCQTSPPTGARHTFRLHGGCTPKGSSCPRRAASTSRPKIAYLPRCSVRRSERVPNLPRKLLSDVALRSRCPTHRRDARCRRRATRAIGDQTRRAHGRRACTCNECRDGPRSLRVVPDRRRGSIDRRRDINGRPQRR